MADARLVPTHTVPATRWPAAIEQLVSKIDQEIAKITAQAHLAAGTIPEIVTTQVGASDQVENTESELDSDMLQPPPTRLVSPPPMRKQLTHN